MRYEITAPDGRRFEVTAPEGATPEQVMAFVQAQMAQAPAQPPRTAAENLGIGARATARGIAGGLPGLMYDAAAAPINLVTRGINAVAGTNIPRIASAVDQVTSAVDALGLPAPRDRDERVRAAGIEGAAAGLSGAGVGGIMARAPGAIGAAGQVLAAQPVVQAASGAIGGAVGAATDSPLAGAAASLAAPLALNAGAAGLRTAVSPGGRIDSERARLIEIARREGVPITAGQATGSRPQKAVEGAFETLPFTSGRAAEQNERQAEAFTRAVLSRAGISAPRATPAVLNQAQQRLSGEYKTLTARNDMRPTPEFADKLRGMVETVETLPDEARGVVKRYLEQVLRLTNPQTGTLPGRAWQNLDSRIGAQANSAQSSDTRTALRELQEALREGMGASIQRYGNPDDWAQWQDLRARYSAFITVRDTMGRAGEGSALGFISPLALRGELAGRDAYAMGRGDLSDLARMGQGLLRAPPNSGTPERTAAMNLVQGGIGGSSAAMIGTGLVTGNPVMVAAGAAPVVLPPLAQRLYNQPWFQAYLRNQTLANMPNPVSREAVGAIAATQAAAPVTGRDTPR